MNNQAILEVIIKARDEASSVMSKVGDSVKSLEPVFKGMMTAGTVGLGAISAIALKTVSDFGEAEKASAQLRHAVMNVSHATEAQLEATSNLADELERKGVLDGDNIKMGLAQLSTFGLSNDAVRGLGGSLADLAVNQFGATASGEQLSDTANMIAKALNGQFGVLEKSGIRFSEAQQHAIKFGSEMEKVKAINEGFAQNLKYTNEVALATFEGQLAKAQVQLGNVSEAIGQALAPKLQELIQAIQPVIEKVMAWVSTHQELVANIFTVGAVVSGLLIVFGGLGMAIASIGAVLSPVVIAVIAIGGALALLTMQMGGTEGMINAVKEAFIWVKNAVMDAYNSVMILWEQFTKTEVFELIISILKMLWASLKDLWQQLKELWDIIEPVILPLLKILGALIVGTVIVAFTAFIAIVTGLIKGVSFLIEVFKPLIKVISETLVWAFNKAIEIGRGFMGFIDSVIGKINDMIALAQRAATAVSGFFGGGGGSAPAYAGGKASGGSVYAGNYYLVGENGPELFAPNSTGTVIPNSGMGGGVTINLSGNTFLGEEDVARKIGASIVQELQFNYKV